MTYQCVIFGESHTSEERAIIEKQLDELYRFKKLDYLLSEEVGSVVADTLAKKKAGIKDEVCSVSTLSYQYSIKYGIPVIGIDDWGAVKKGRTKREIIEDREKRMLIE